LETANSAASIVQDLKRPLCSIRRKTIDKKNLTIAEFQCSRIQNFFYNCKYFTLPSTYCPQKSLILQRRYGRPSKHKLCQIYLGYASQKEAIRILYLYCIVKANSIKKLEVLSSWGIDKIESLLSTYQTIEQSIDILYEVVIVILEAEEYSMWSDFTSLLSHVDKLWIVCNNGLLTNNDWDPY